MQKFTRFCVLISILALLLSGCSGSSGSSQTKVLRQGATPYEIPDFQPSLFSEEQAVKAENLLFDTSHSANGYVGLKILGDEALKFQIESGSMKYNYDVYPGEEPTFFPLNMGSGSYTFRLMRNVGDNRYALIWKTEQILAPEDEFGPFLHPSQIISYTEDSQCVALARSLAAGCETQSDVVSAIYEYLVKNISYDRELAASVTSDYLPDPDRTLSLKKGICYDYASLAAAMIRSMGIPCKLIMGYVDGNLYHAWNSFYLEDQGWITVEIKAVAGVWQRVDITMAASGEKASRLEDDSRYTTRYTY